MGWGRVAVRLCPSGGLVVTARIGSQLADLFAARPGVAAEVR